MSGYGRFFRYRQFLLNVRVRRRAIGVIEWLRRILPRSFLSLPKRAPFPKNEKLLFLGNGTAQPLSCVHDLYSFVLVFGLIGARNQHPGEASFIASRGDTLRSNAFSSEILFATWM